MSNENTKAKTICEALRRELQGMRALPSERALMRRFDAARETVRRALAELQAEGLVVRQVGKGTFPSKRARQVPGRIGLIVLSYAEIFAPICAEIGRLCRARGLELLFGDVSALDYTARAEQARRFARDFVAQRVSGVILQPIGFMENAAALNAEMRDLFAAANVPVVLLDSGWPDGLGAADVVGVDNFRCGQALAEHLLAQGARRSLFLTRPHAPPSNQLRYEGVRSRMDCNILRMEPDNATALRKALKRHRPDALACGYDAYAAQVLKTLGGLGVSVPNDILLTGFDDVKYATLVSPPLTTVHQPCTEIARAAFEALLTRSAEPDRTPRTILLNAPLVARDKLPNERPPNYLTVDISCGRRWNAVPTFFAQPPCLPFCNST